jgi:LPXTG-motif cell wall-anchored protein
VILRLPSGENRRYFIDAAHPAKFYDDQGKEISVFDLKKNMNIKATRITEAPTVELATNVAVTGTAPQTAVAEAQPAEPRSTSGAQAARPAAAPAAQTAAAAPAERTASTQTAQSGLPKKLPTTGSSLSLVALLGLVLIGAGLVVRAYRSS